MIVGTITQVANRTTKATIPKIISIFIASSCVIYILIIASQYFAGITEKLNPYYVYIKIVLPGECFKEVWK